MKEKLLNVLKWFFIVLGVLFFIQLLILSGIFIGLNSIKEPNIKIEPPNFNLKEIKPVVDYAQKYWDENGKYPDSVEIKIKKGEYKYESNEDFSCYKIIYTNKKIEKTYNRCSISADGVTSKSESYSEIIK